MLTLEAVAFALSYDRLRRVISDDVIEGQRATLAEARSPEIAARFRPLREAFEGARRFREAASRRIVERAGAGVSL